MLLWVCRAVAEPQVGHALLLVRSSATGRCEEVFGARVTASSRSRHSDEVVRALYAFDRSDGREVTLAGRMVCPVFRGVA